MVLAIMFVFPIHQSMGQLGATMLYATGRVRAQVVFGIATMASSIPVSYFVLASADAPISGFGLGSVGLAGKMVVLQILAANAVAFYLVRSMRISFDWTHQLKCCLGCLGSGWVAWVISHEIHVISGHVWAGLIVSATLHLLILFSLIWLVPSLIGLSRSELISKIHVLTGTKLSHGNRLVAAF